MGHLMDETEEGLDAFRAAPDWRGQELLAAAARAAWKADAAQTRTLEWIALGTALALIYLAWTAPSGASWTGSNGVALAFVGAAIALLISHELRFIKVQMRLRDEIMKQYCEHQRRSEPAG